MKNQLSVSLASMLVLNVASAQNLFVADYSGNNITKITPGGTESTFASGLNEPIGVALNSAGNLFVSDSGSGNIYEYTPGGVQSTFASRASQFLAVRIVHDPRIDNDGLTCGSFNAESCVA